MGIAIGIDLGTTNSCVAVVQANRAKVVTDPAGRRIQPSVVSFLPENEPVAGHAAKDRQILDVENTIYSFKRLIGRDFNDPQMQQLLADLPYEVTVGSNNVPSVKVRGENISLPEVSAMMLKHLREMCEENLGVRVTDAVITVPANFNDVQRSSTKVAGRIAGFNVLRILNEPTAAALAYGFGGKLTERIAIFDFGGGTFDITIVELSDEIFEVLSTAGDTYLGGDDFDKIIVEQMRSDFMEMHDSDLADDKVAMQRIRSVAEKVKCQLSSLDEVQATLREIGTDKKGNLLDFNFKLTRQRFEKLVEPLVERSLKVCDEALKLAGLDRSSLDNLVLVGGTTRVPLVRSQVAKYFGMRPRTEINPDEVVAIGASIQAFSLTGEQLPENLPKPKPKPKPKPVSIAQRYGIANTALTNDSTSDSLPAVLSVPEDLGIAPKAPKKDPFADMDLAPTPKVPKKDPFADMDLAPTPKRQNPDQFGLSPKPQPKANPPMAIPVGLDNPDDLGSLDLTPAAYKDQTGLDLLDEYEEILEIDSDLLEEEEVLEQQPVVEANVAETPAIKMPIDESDFGDLGFDSDESWGFGEEEPADSSGIESIHKTPEPEIEPPKDIVHDEIAPIEEEAGHSYAVPTSEGGAPSALLLDVTPRALGVATAGGFCDIAIERNAAIPVEQSRLFTTSSSEQTEVTINIMQGESRRVEENTLLGQVMLTNIRSAHRGEIKIKVTFEIDTDGILGVSACNQDTGEAQSTRISLTGGLDEEHVEELVRKHSDK